MTTPVATVPRLLMRLVPVTLVSGLLLSLAPTPGCRAGSGDACRCASDCKTGFVCAAEGLNPLTMNDCNEGGAGCCYPTGSVTALCIPGDAVADLGEGLSDGPDMFPYTKRDLSHPTTSGSDSDTEATTDTGTDATTDDTDTDDTDTGDTDT
ncbi:MAG: hypothetical protein ACPG77_20825, partial [Nannocystaceae bacterium]